MINRMLFLIVSMGSTFSLQAADSATIQVPDNFFQAYVTPDDRIHFGYANPDMRSAQAQNNEWLAAVAKIRLLFKSSSTFNTVFTETVNDPALQEAGVTFAEWSEGTSDQKQAAQAKLQRSIDRVVAKHGLLTLFHDSEVDPAQLDAKINELRGTTSVVLPLVRYCPGSTNHVAVNTADKDFPRFQAISKSPEYRKAVEAFNAYLKENPKAPVDERDRKIKDLVTPLMH